MKKNNTFIMVSGPAACGKTTLVNGLVKNFKGYFYKPSKAYIDLSLKRNIPIDRAFYDISFEDASDYFINICLNNEIVVGDQHLAIQPIKDSLLASGVDVSSIDKEPFVKALDYNIFNKLKDNDINTILIYLKASKDILYSRAISRFKDNGQLIRNSSIEDVLDEALAEEEFYYDLINTMNINHFMIDTDNMNSDEVLEYAIQRVKQYRR